MTVSWTVRAEACKLVTSPAALLVFIMALIIPMLLAMATGFANGANHGAIQVPVQDQGFEVAGFGQPLVILLAAMTMSSEYTDGQITTTLAATPNRRRLLAAKAIVVAGAATIIGLIASPTSAMLEQWSRSLATPRGGTITFTTPMMLNVLTVALNYTMIALLSLALTTITRSIIATLVIMIPMVLGITIGLVPIFPILKYLPDLAGIQLLTHYPSVPLLAPLPGAFVMAAWTITMLTLAAILFTKRDIGQ